MSAPLVPLELTVALRGLVDLHQQLIDVAQPRGKGRAPSLERDMAAHFSRAIREAWGAAGSQKGADAFAATAMAWLTGRKAPASDAAIARGRTRRKT